jgi:hypothetical protein
MGSISKRKLFPGLAVALSAILFTSVAEAGGKRCKGRRVQNDCCYVASCCAPNPGWVATASHMAATAYHAAPSAPPPYSQPDPVKQNVYAGFSMPTQIVFRNFRAQTAEGTPFTPVAAELRFISGGPIGGNHVGTITASSGSIHYNSTTFVLIVSGTISGTASAVDGIAGIDVTVVGSDPTTQNRTQFYAEKVWFHNHAP